MASEFVVEAVPVEVSDEEREHRLKQAFDVVFGREADSGFTITRPSNGADSASEN
jgi:hypothetical protein